jgi:hypothetical protein
LPGRPAARSVQIGRRDPASLRLPPDWFEHLLACSFGIDQDDLKQVLEPAAEELHELLLELRSSAPSTGLDRRDVFCEIPSSCSLGADDLIEAIGEHYERLPDDLQALLPLKRIWAIVLED